MVTAPPSALRPKAGLFVTTATDLIAAVGIRSQVMGSPNASLIRTPFWDPANPCGVPDTGDATNPLNSTFGWKGLPDTSLTLTAGTLCCSASVMFSELVRWICPESTKLMVEGTLSTARAVPGDETGDVG